MSGHVEPAPNEPLGWGDEYGPQRDPGDEDPEPNYVATYLPDPLSNTEEV